MSFGENLQFYRKRKDITQEQLAEQMGVSRQTISKWESDSSYPEMEKLLLLCDLFGCTMDVLLRGEARKSFQEDTAGYDGHMNRFIRNIVAGITVILAGMAVGANCEGLGIPEYIEDAAIIIGIVTGALILIAAGMQHSRFTKKHPYIEPFYKEEEKENFDQRYIVLMLTGIGILLAGIIFMVLAESIPVPQGFTRKIYDGAIMVFVTAGVPVIVWTGLQKSKYNIEEYNRDHDPKRAEEEKVRVEKSESEERRDRLISMLCSCIMILCTIIYVVAGFGFNLWEKAWIVYIVGIFLCGIVNVVVNGVIR